MKISKKEGFNSLMRSVCAWLILFCLSLCSPLVLGQTKKPGSNQVFCPLQEKWVSQTSLPVAHYKDPLDEICSSDQRKKMFFFELSKHLFAKFASSHQTEEKFFGYLTEGKQIFARITLPSNLPHQQIANLVTTEKSGAGNFQADFTRTAVEAFSYAQFPVRRLLIQTQNSTLNSLQN